MSVQYQFADRVAVIQMDDGKANALSHAMLEQLEAAFDRVEAETEARAVVIAGRPGLFCGGFDTKVILGGTPEEAQKLFMRGGALLHRLITYPRPLVAAATGHSVAMGAFLLLASDYRIGARGDFKIGLNESAAGIEIPYMGVQLAQERLQPAFITQSLALARLFDPETAVAAGFLDQTAAPDQLLEEARRAAAQFAELVPAAFAANKKSLRKQLLKRIESGV